MQSLVVLGIFTSFIHALPSTRDSNPVCIVGAGPSGLSAAKALEAKGKSTVIFEKRTTVGGKCQSYYQGGEFYPLGAVLFSNTEGYAETFKLVQSLGVEYEPFIVSDSFYYDPTTGVEEEMGAPSNATLQAIAEEFPRYSQVYQERFAPIGVPGYKNGIPDEFTMPTRDWLLANNFTVLAAVINEFAGKFGYGPFDTVPAVYLLQFFTPDLLAISMGFPGTNALKIDFFNVWSTVAKSLSAQINLGVSVTGISRGDAPSIQYSDASQNMKTQACSDVILAFPPTTSALKAANFQPSPVETALFNQVTTNNYFASAVQMNQLPPENITFTQALPGPITPFVPEGQPVYFLPLHPTSIASVYSAGGSATTDDEIRSQLVQDLSKFNKNPHNAQQASVPISDKDILAFSGHIDYFPRVETASLQGGWYKTFEANQGAGHIYYASGLNNFELVEYAIRAANDLVASHF